MMVAADSGYASIDDMDGAVVCVAAGTTTEGNVATEFAARGLTVDVQSFDDIDLVQEAFISRPVRRLVERRQPAGVAPGQLPGRPRLARHLRRRVLQGAADAGRHRRRHGVGAGRRVGDLRHDPGRGAGHHVGDGRGRRRPATTPPRCCSSAAPTPTARRSIRASACRPTSRCRSSRQVGNYGEIFEANLPADRHRGARPQRAVVRRRPAVRPAVPLIDTIADRTLTDTMATATGRPPLWRDVRVLAWAFQIVGGRGGRRRRAGGSSATTATTPSAQEPQHRLRRSSTSRPASRSRRATFRQTQRDAGRHRRGLLQHAAAGDHRHRAGHGPRHADRRRPAVAELHRAQRGAGLRRVRPQRPAAGARDPGLHRRRAERVPAAERRRGSSARSP